MMKKPGTIGSQKTPSNAKHLAKCLHQLIIFQFNLGFQAVHADDEGLAQLMAFQIFDLIDWARVNLNNAQMVALQECVRVNLESRKLSFKSLTQLENYAEDCFIHQMNPNAMSNFLVD